MANKNIDRNDLRTNTTPVVLDDNRRPWARPAVTDDDPWVVGPDGLVTRLSDLRGRDTDPWDNRH